MAEDLQFDGINKKDRNAPAHNTKDVYNELYFERDSSHERGRKHLPKHKNITDDQWGDSRKKEKKKIKIISSKLMFKFFIGAFVFAFGAAGYLFLSLQGTGKTVSSQNIAVDISSKAFVDGGENADVRVVVGNQNPLKLELVDLVLEYYPNGQNTLGSQPERVRRSVGTVAAGEEIEESFDVSLYGAEGDQRDIAATLEYRVPGSKAVFYKNDTTTVGIRSAPVLFVLTAPEAIIANQQAEFTLDITSQKSQQARPLRVAVDYPEGFVFKESQPGPSIENNVWDVGVIPFGQTKTITIKGSIQGFAADQRVIRAKVGALSVENKLTSIVASASQAIELEAPFLDIKVFANKQSGKRVMVAGLDPLEFTIDWRNTLDETIRNIVITADIQGASYNPQRVEVDRGFFDSNNHQLKWERISNEEFAIAEPGARGSVKATLDPLPLVSPSGVRIDRPEVMLTFHMKAEGDGGRVYEAEQVFEQTAVFTTDPTLITETLYSSGSFPNTGPEPPKVGQKTTYTLHWMIQNPANELEDVQVSTTLPLWVSWGALQSPAKENLSYNAQSRQVIWRPGKLVAGTGFGQSKKEVFFQISITPSAAQQGAIPRLTNEVILNSLDSFTNIEVNKQVFEHTTTLRGDVVKSVGLVQ